MVWLQTLHKRFGSGNGDYFNRGGHETERDGLLYLEGLEKLVISRSEYFGIKIGDKKGKKKKIKHLCIGLYIWYF